MSDMELKRQNFWIAVVLTQLTTNSGMPLPELKERADYMLDAFDGRFGSESNGNS